MKYLHTMVRVCDVAASLDFYCTKLGFRELRRVDNEQGRFTLVFLAYAVDDIYATCQRLLDGGVTINRPPRVPVRDPWASMPNCGRW